MIPLDEEVTEIYCMSICKTPQSQCALCTLRKIVDASQLKLKGKTATEALDEALNRSEVILKSINNHYDADNANRYKVNLT